MTHSNTRYASTDPAVLMSDYQLVDVELTDVTVDGDAKETITVTFAPGEVAEALGLGAKGMLPAQATELALALMDASRGWEELGALYAHN